MVFSRARENVGISRAKLKRSEARGARKANGRKEVPIAIDEFNHAFFIQIQRFIRDCSVYNI